MRFVISRTLVMPGIMLLPLTLFAQSMEAWRGAWIADDGDERIVLYLVFFVENGPISNVTDAQIALNEMQMTTVASFAPDGRKFEMTFLGPTR